ncbi:MAG: MBL fold metallo-hydrolase [Clostridia bacterium]|nr:MBL fold metallo-hydrolase [Clostridia bacterium]
MNIKVTDMRSVPGDSAFLIDDGKTAILYDSGFAFTGYAVADKIKAYLGERNLDYIFLTHSHYDHALGSVYALRYWPDAKVVAGEYAVKIFAKPTARALMRELDGKFARTNKITDYEDLIDSLRVDIPVSDGDKIAAGDMVFTVVNLPGHTKCSVGFYLESEKLLLGCETLGVFDGDKAVVPSFLVGYQMSLDSIKKAAALGVKNILVPHCGLLDEKTTKLYFSNSVRYTAETAQEIVDILKSGGSKKDALSFFKDKFYHGKVRDMYPIDAMELNTSIMINLIEKELC